MIPIRDTLPSRNHPIVNSILIGINVVVFLVQLAMGPGEDIFLYIFGLVPARYSVDSVSHYFSTGQQMVSFLSFMFLHGGFLHLAGNMWFLYIFGDNVEDQMGHIRYLAFYLACGVGSGLIHIAFNASSSVPVIGASGAIAGVMGAYLILYPHAKILTLIPIIIIPWFVEIPAFFFLGFWFVIQFINAAMTHGELSGVAWQAHAGGFVIGMALLKASNLLPAVGVTKRMEKATQKKKTETFQVVRPSSHGDGADLYGDIFITPFEALTGAKKIVNIPWGFHKRLFRIEIPSGIRAGKILRLAGAGKRISNGKPGDMMLTVFIRSS